MDGRAMSVQAIIGLWLVGIAISSTVVGGCKKEEATPGATAASDPAALAGGNTEFALDLYDEIRHQEGNLFLSPYSISSALAMTNAGARGNTAIQMAQVLHFDLEGESLHATFAALTDGLNEKGRQGDFELSVANALWGQKGFKFLDPFTELNTKYYGAGLNLLDFQSDAEGARRTINAWVEKETKEKIRDLLKPGVLNAFTRLVLTNAIYFKGKWARQFDSEDTRDEDFWLTPEQAVKVPMMRQKADFSYIETDSLQVLELPYEGDALSMVVLLPNTRAGLPALEQSLNADTLSAWLDMMTEQEVMVMLPRFKVTSEFGLADVLAAMGMEDAFSAEKADFSGMTGKRDLYISAVVHKAFVDVNEEGTEAAAATAVTMMLTAVREGPPVFRADHPFVFLIRDKASGSILFMGRLAAPTPG